MGSPAPATSQAGHTMGTKLSKQNPTPTVEDKAATLPPASSTPEENNLAAKSESLPRSGFERTTGLGKSFRKSMRKLVGKKKVKEEETEKKESAAGEQTESTVEAEEKEEKEETATIEEEKEEEKEENEEVLTTTETEPVDQEEEAVNVSLIGTPCADEKEEDVGVDGCKSQQEAKLTEESLDSSERDTTCTESLVHQLEEEGESSEKCEVEDDVNNGGGNRADEDNEVNELEKTPVVRDVAEAESEGNDEEIKTEQEVQEDAEEKSDADNSSHEEEEEKSSEAFDENLIESSGSESLESKSDDLNSEEGSEEGVTTDEGIVESDDDNNGSEENFETLKSKQCADVISEEAALESAD